MRSLRQKWFPAAVDLSDWEKRLNAFYQENKEYHVMTAGSGNKVKHPQIAVLMSQIQPGGHYAEIGCGGGVVCALVAEHAHITGLDISSFAISKARERCASQDAAFVVGSAIRLPFDDNAFDGVYSFEMLEHLWDPVASLREMARVVRPGGFILLSTPNLFSLDLHLSKRLFARSVDVILAGLRLLYDRVRLTPFVNVTPDLEADPVYPDCDMVASFVPYSLQQTILELGCDVEFLDTYYMCSLAARKELPLAFQ